MNKITIRFTAVLCLLALLFSLTACGKKDDTKEDGKAPIQNEETTNQNSGDSQEPGDKQETEKKPVEPIDPVSLDDALFIGDSRTVGMMEYANSKADYFATVGMSVYNIHDDPVSVPSVGKVTLEGLLKSKTYGKIYVMLGINEVGYNMDRTIDEYSDLLHELRKAQPDAAIFLQGNLHVSKENSDKNEYVTNERLDSLNQKIAKLAEKEGVYYLDVNTQFDDANGALDMQYTSDGVHPYAKYYIQWSEWIAKESAAQLKEG